MAVERNVVTDSEFGNVSGTVDDTDKNAAPLRKDPDEMIDVSSPQT